MCIRDRSGVLTNDFFVNLLDMNTVWKPTSEAGEDVYKRQSGPFIARTETTDGLIIWTVPLPNPFRRCWKKLTKTPPEFFGADEMKPKNRYAVFDLPERQFQPSSRGKVLRNKVGAVSYTHLDVYKRQVPFQ